MPLPVLTAVTVTPRDVPVSFTLDRARIGARVQAMASASGGWLSEADAKELLGVADATETSFGWHVGAGLAMALAPRIGLFAEYRAIFTDPDRELGAQVREAIRNLDFDSANAIAGISLYF